MERILYLDGLPSSIKGRLTGISSLEDIYELYETDFLRSECPVLCLDCRGLPKQNFGNLLKFIEEYRGGLELLAYDPVPTPILSRFVEVQKNFIPENRNMLEAKLRNLPEGMKRRMYALFDLGEPEEVSEEF